MAFSSLSEDEQRVLFIQLCNVLEPRLAVALSSASRGLWTLMQALRQQLRADHEVAAALCLKMGLQSCQELREAKEVTWMKKGLSDLEILADLATLGTLGSVLPALESLIMAVGFNTRSTPVPDGGQRLFQVLGAGALPAVTLLGINFLHVGVAGASALAAALDRGALPRLKSLVLDEVAISDTGLLTLAPALRRLTVLEQLNLSDNPLGDEGLAALVAPLPPPPSAPAVPPPTAGVLTKLKALFLHGTRVTDAGCATLASALGSGALPALERLDLDGIPASAASQEAVYEARANLQDARSESEQEEEDEDDSEDGEEDEF